MIVEPIMMNAGIIHPEPTATSPGSRTCCTRTARCSTFDEVKTGLTVGPGGVVRAARRDARPDLPGQGDRRRHVDGGDRRHATTVMGLIADGGYEQVGTFNGNPLAMAVGPGDADRGADRRRRTHTSTASASGCATGLEDVIDRHDAALARGDGRRQGLRRPSCPTRSATSATSSELDGRYGHAHWLVQHNRGAFLPPWGKVEQWLLSVQHTDEDVDRFVANCDHLADAAHGCRLMAGCPRPLRAGQAVR